MQIEERQGDMKHARVEIQAEVPGYTLRKINKKREKMNKAGQE
jgi:hypothetical protein